MYLHFFAVIDCGWIDSQHTRIAVAFFIAFRFKNPILKPPSRRRAEGEGGERGTVLIGIFRLGLGSVQILYYWFEFVILVNL